LQIIKTYLKTWKPQNRKLPNSETLYIKILKFKTLTSYKNTTWLSGTLRLWKNQNSKKSQTNNHKILKSLNLGIQWFCCFWVVGFWTNGDWCWCWGFLVLHVGVCIFSGWGLWLRTSEVCDLQFYSFMFLMSLDFGTWKFWNSYTFCCFDDLLFCGFDVCGFLLFWGFVI